MTWAANEASLPTNSKFNIQELEWNPEARSKNGNIPGAFTRIGPTFISDATISENYSLQANNTTYPVEAGKPISDTGGITNYQITFSAVTSNTTFSIIDNIANIGQVFASSAFGQQFSSAQSRVQEAYSQLMAWSDGGTPLYVKTTYEKSGYTDQYGDIAPFKIASLNISRDANTGDAIGYTMTLQQVYIARVAFASAGQINLSLEGEQQSSALANEELLIDTAKGDTDALDLLSNEEVGKTAPTAGNYLNKAQGASTQGPVAQ
jgi:hypothetical protein